MPFRAKLKKVLHIDEEGSSAGSAEAHETSKNISSTGNGYTKESGVSRNGSRPSSQSYAGVSTASPKSRNSVGDRASNPATALSSESGRPNVYTASKAPSYLDDAPAPQANGLDTVRTSPAVTGSGVSATGSGNPTPHLLMKKASSPDLKQKAYNDTVENSSSSISPLPHRDMAASQHVRNGEYLVKDAAVAPSLNGVVDLTNTVDTTVEEKWAPAVTHEIVHREHHHIREEVITREIHHHHVFHRILPVIDIEVLPARHFVPDGRGGKIEISEDEIPGRVGPYQQRWAIVENVTKSIIKVEPRKFTARQFEAEEGQYKEYVSAAGVPTTETTWIHAPTIEKLGEYSGQTEAFHFECETPRENGLRVYAPTGPVSGSSRLHAEQNGYAAPLTQSMDGLTLAEHAANPPAARAQGKMTEEIPLGASGLASSRV